MACANVAVSQQPPTAALTFNFRVLQVPQLRVELHLVQRAAGSHHGVDVLHLGDAGLQQHWPLVVDKLLHDSRELGAGGRLEAADAKGLGKLKRNKEHGRG